MIKCIGFVVNIHDATNFDIDLDLPDRLVNKYSQVISNEYSYSNVNISPTKVTLSEEIISRAYRCRLRGVIIHRELAHGIWKTVKVISEIKALIDRADGWITCTVNEMDIYKRLLIDITVTIGTNHIDIAQFLLKHTLLFHQYKSPRTKSRLLFYPPESHSNTDLIYR